MYTAEEMNRVVAAIRRQPEFSRTTSSQFATWYVVGEDIPRQVDHGGDFIAVSARRYVGGYEIKAASAAADAVLTRALKEAGLAAAGEELCQTCLGSGCSCGRCYEDGQGHEVPGCCSICGGTGGTPVPPVVSQSRRVPRW